MAFSLNVTSLSPELSFLFRCHLTSRLTDIKTQTDAMGGPQHERAPPTPPPQAQDRPLLALPPEIRNIIYEYACCSIDKALMEVRYKSPYGYGYLKAHPRLVDVAHALERTCRLVRAEFQPILARADRKNARGLIWKVHNFYMDDEENIYEIENYLDSLPLCDGKKRTLSKQVTVDENFDFDRHNCSMRYHIWFDEHFATKAEKKDKTVRVRTSIHFDPLTFNTRELEGCLHRCEFGEFAGPFHSLRWPIIDALEWHRQIRWELEGARCARRKAENAKNAKKEGPAGKDVAPALPAVRRITRR